MHAGPGPVLENGVKEVASTGLEVRVLGLVPYRQGLKVQQRVREEVASGARPGVLLALRHPPVITLGRRTDPQEVHRSPEDLARLGIDLVAVDRGGGATWHYPEQAVVYPVLDLQVLRLTVPALLQCLGDAVVDCLARLGVEALWDPDRPGAYVEGAKIASVGLHLHRGISTHGIAVNLGRDLRGFRWVDPCKMAGLPVTSVEDRTGRCPDPDGVARDLALALARRLPVPERLDRRPVAPEDQPATGREPP